MKLENMELKTGDIINCYSNRLLSKLIRFFTKSSFSHTAMYINIYDNDYIIESQKNGVHLLPVDVWKEKYKYTFEVYRYDNSNVYELRKKALSVLGTRYDFKSLIITQPLYQMTNEKKWFDKKSGDKRFYCSEYIAWCYDIKDWYKMTPEDVY